MFDFTKANNCDLIVQPQFSIDATTKVLFSVDKYEDVKVTLIGFPATYKNIRKFEPKDTLSFQLYKVTGFERDVPVESINEKKSKLGTFLGLGTVLALVYTLLKSIL